MGEEMLDTRKRVVDAVLWSMGDILGAGLDADWAEFLAEELEEGLEYVWSSEEIEEAIMEHLVLIRHSSQADVAASVEAQCSNACSALLTRLREEGLVPSPHTEKLDEIAEEENTEDSTNVEDLLEDGACELCERHIPLTKHHVYPRQLHTRLKKLGLKRDVLHSGIMICRACHSAVHSFYSNAELAANWHSRELLLESPKVQKWIPYIRKRKCTSRRNVVAHPTW